MHTYLITLQALILMPRLMSSEENTCVLKGLIPALKNSLLHAGGLLSGGQLQWMLAHCRQELENQLSALRLSSTTFAAERRGGNGLHSPSSQWRSPLAGQPNSTLLEVRKTRVIKSDGQMETEHPVNFLNMTSREKHKMSLGFMPLLRQHFKALTAYVHTPKKEQRALWMQTISQHFPPSC